MYYSRAPLFLLIIGLLLGASGCQKDEGTLATSGVNITFRTDSGYTFLGDTVAQGDSLRIGVVIIPGADDLERFYLAIKLDGGPEMGQDTTAVNETPFTYGTVHVTRLQPGNEQVIFTVEEPDGDRTTRRLTFTVL